MAIAPKIVIAETSNVRIASSQAELIASTVTLNLGFRTIAIVLVRLIARLEKCPTTAIVLATVPKLFAPSFIRLE